MSLWRVPDLRDNISPHASGHRVPDLHNTIALELLFALCHIDVTRFLPKRLCIVYQAFMT